MKPRNAPVFATWLLKLFCSGPEHDSVIGDLTEKYQQHGGRFRYWRESLDIVLHAVYCKVARRPLNSPGRIHVGTIFAVLLVFVGLAIVLLSDIAPILLIPVVIGSWVGILRFVRYDEPTGSLTWDPGGKLIARGPVTSLNAPAVARIDSSKIAVGGGTGAGILILVLLTAVLHDLPILRVLAIPFMVVGLLAGVLGHFWRERHPRDIEKDFVSIRLK